MKEADAEEPVTIPAMIVRLRHQAGWSQAALARRAGTSQPAIARYESGAATPSWGTLERIVSALGHHLRVDAAPQVDQEHVRLAHELLALTPAERLDALARFARLRERAEVVPRSSAAARTHGAAS